MTLLTDRLFKEKAKKVKTLQIPQDRLVQSSVPEVRVVQSIGTARPGLTAGDSRLGRGMLEQQTRS